MKKALALLLALLLCCGAALAQEAQEEMRVAAFQGKFSPFFAAGDGDRLVAQLTQGQLLVEDPDGEDASALPEDYYGMGSVREVINADGSADYFITMRSDIVFSDGTPANIDDVIFGIYVCADPDYDGPLDLAALPIEGIVEYRDDRAPLGVLLAESGRDNDLFDLWDVATQNAFWAELDAAGPAFAQTIVDYCLATHGERAESIGATQEELAADAALQLRLAMELWGYGDAWFEGATTADFWQAMLQAYDGDPIVASHVEMVGTSILECMDGYQEKYGHCVALGDAVDQIAGVIRTGEYSLTLHSPFYDADMLARLQLVIAPLHHYGDESQYDYAKNRFGFPKGDLSGLRAKNGNVLGCGEYVLESYADGAVTLHANDENYMGAPDLETLVIRAGK